MRPPARRALHTRVLVPRAPYARFQSTRSTSSSDDDATATATLSPRFLSDVKARIGRCINFGIGSEQVAEAGAILREVNDNWRELVVGREGFLTGGHRWGLYRQKVAWGEMVS